MTILKPFLMLACVAFVVGFMGFLAVYRLASPLSDAPAPPWSSEASAPAPAPSDWNAGKLI